METPESQALVNAACQQVESVSLDQMVLEERRKLLQDQTKYECMKQKHAQVPRKPKMISVVQLQQELKELQSKYGQLCSKLETQE